KQLTVFFRPLEGDPYAVPPGQRTVALECEVSGVDKAGIVARVARTLADHDVNITALQTQSRPGPETGTPMFTMGSRRAARRTVERRVRRERLERVAADLRVDLTLAELRPA